MTLLYPADHNCYQLRIRLHQDARIKVGALGTFELKAGEYIYSGSAKRNLDKRVARHCRKRKPKRWHIDYLTSHHHAEVVAVETFVGNECQLNQAVVGEIPVAGLGASDCRRGCGSHLKYLAPLAD